MANWKEDLKQAAKILGIIPTQSKPTRKPSPKPSYKPQKPKAVRVHEDRPRRKTIAELQAEVNQVIEPQLHEMLGTGPNARPVTERGVRAAQAAKYAPKPAVMKREEIKEGQSVHAMGEWWNNYAKFNKYQGFK